MITKTDVPYLARDYMMIVTLVAAIITWPLCAVVWPDLRPGVIEAIVGFLWAPLFARIWSRAWITYISEVALASRDNPWLKWIPLLPSRCLGDYMAKSRLGVLAGGILAEATVFVLWVIVPHIPSPWAQWSTYTRSDIAPFMSMGLSAIAYVCGVALLMSIYTLRWYGTLPFARES